MEVSHIPQGLFETLLSLLRLLWSLLCNHVSMRQFGCTAPLLYRGNCQLLCAQTVPINSASVESCLPMCPFDMSSSKHKQLKFLNLFYKDLRDDFCVGSDCSKRPYPFMFALFCITCLLAQLLSKKIIAPLSIFSAASTQTRFFAIRITINRGQTHPKAPERAQNEVFRLFGHT